MYAAVRPKMARVMAIMRPAGWKMGIALNARSDASSMIFPQRVGRSSNGGMRRSESTPLRDQCVYTTGLGGPVAPDVCTIITVED